ncbi:MAG: flippase-like domain-containing protein [Deltaproteobacteria bacterium]|nr:flippase-like domain-containing protein [Deltaproteobacteria bacterium]
MIKSLNWKLWAGLLVGVLFLYLAFREVEFGQMWDSLKSANYWFLLPATFIIFFSHFLRAFRWRFLLDPVKRVDIPSLFSALMIGYGANMAMPAHLGEFLRAYVLSQKHKIPVGSVFATIVMERIIDVFSLLVLMFLAVLLHPFPEWVVKSGYIMFAAALGLFVFLVLFKKFDKKTDHFLHIILKAVPERFGARIMGSTERFFSGILPLKRRGDYAVVVLVSVSIWICYAFVFYVCFQAFDFIKIYHLPWYTGLILLVITTISVVVPSSPGYVGLYHFLCQISLAMFAVPESPALSYAAVVHAVNFLPVLALALLFAGYEGLRIYSPDIKEDAVSI